MVGISSSVGAPVEALAAARRAVDALPAHSGSTDRLRVAVVAAATGDPLRFDLSREAVLAAARSLVPTLVGALPVAAGAPSAADGTEEAPATSGARLARQLWPKLTARPADEPSVAALDAALALLIDHDLAASTLAARVAASAPGARCALGLLRHVRGGR